MKKALILGLMALTATFASASSTIWTNTTTKGTTIENWTFASGSTITLCLDNVTSSVSTITTGDILTSIVMVKSASSAKTASYMKITASDGTSYVSNAMTLSENSIVITNAAGGTYTRSELTYTFGGNITLDTSLTYTLSFYSDADCTIGADAAFAITNALDDGLSNNRTNEWEPLMTINAEHASVPEPTVLALLALGVAGLALKRRV